MKRKSQTRQMRLARIDEKQTTLLLEVPPEAPNEKVYAVAFRRLYYHLYSNSNSSRAERIIADLSNLLLCKIAAERSGEDSIIRSFVSGEGTANEVLRPILTRAFPHLVSDADEFVLQDDALRHGLRELAPLSFHSAPAHILGEAFQALMGPRLRGDKGQFFTPKSLVRSMIGVLRPEPTSKVVDPACGTGGFLVETQAVQEASTAKLQLPLAGTAGSGIALQHTSCTQSKAGQIRGNLIRVFQRHIYSRKRANSLIR